MKSQLSVEGNTATIDLSGKLTVQTSPDLNKVVNSLAPQICKLTIDLADVEFVSSAGLRVIVSADKLMVSRGGGLLLLNPTDEVMDVFEMTGLSDVLVIDR